MIPTGRQFYKMTGSGNDFVFVDVRESAAGELERPEIIREVCARGSGVGADGIVFLNRNDVGLSIRYLNSDGSLAALCGNATLCAARLGAELGIVSRAGEFQIETDSGPVAARFRHGLPEIDLPPVTELQENFAADPGPGESRIGFASVGVPHLVVECADVQAVAVVQRGRRLRHDPRLSQGANVNFVSRLEDHWQIRTYERGVEAETLACGTGAVATGLMLAAWGEASNEVQLETRSGRRLLVRHRERIDGGGFYASLSGEARIVFVGGLGELCQSTR
jgi:diaminopimelate epimerase